MAGTSKGKGGASGRRTSVVFGTGSKTVNGKKTTVSLSAKIRESTIKALDIKFKKAATGAAPKMVVDKAKRKRLASAGNSTGSAKRALRCSIDGVKFYSVIVPTGMGYGQAIVNLTAQSKARVFITPAGTRRETGEIKSSAKSTKK